MTKSQLRKKVNELISQSAKAQRDNIDKVLKSGAVNLSDFEDNYLLPKIVISALLTEEIHQYKPFSNQKTHLKAVNNIYRCM